MTQDKGAVMSLLSFGAANWMSNSDTVLLLFILQRVWGMGKGGTVCGARKIAANVKKDILVAR